MDLTHVEWQGGMSCARSSDGAGARVGDLSSRLGGLSSTYLLKGDPGEA